MLCEIHRSRTALVRSPFSTSGASDGITTVEAVRALRKAFGDGVQAILADRNIWLMRYRRGLVVEYRAADGEPIMARLGRIACRLSEQRREVHPDSNPMAHDPEIRTVS